MEPTLIAPTEFYVSIVPVIELEGLVYIILPLIFPETIILPLRVSVNSILPVIGPISTAVLSSSGIWIVPTSSAVLSEVILSADIPLYDLIS